MFVFYLGAYGLLLLLLLLLMVILSLGAYGLFVFWLLLLLIVIFCLGWAIPVSLFPKFNAGFYSTTGFVYVTVGI